MYSQSIRSTRLLPRFATSINNNYHIKINAVKKSCRRFCKSPDYTFLSTCDIVFAADKRKNALFAVMNQRIFSPRLPCTLPPHVEFHLTDGTQLTAPVVVTTRARRLRLRMDHAGNLTLVTPPDIPLALLQQHIPHFQAWLERAWKKQQASLPEQSLPTHISLPLTKTVFSVQKSAQLPPQQHMAQIRRTAAHALFISGQARALAGLLTRMLVIEEPGIVSVFGTQDDMRLCAAALQIWCRDTAKRLLPPYVAQLAASDGLTLTGISIRDQRSRWGSCSRQQKKSDVSCARQPDAGHISLNWRALLLPIPLLDHLCWHELCHLRHMNHSAAYHAELARHSPGWAAYEKALNQAWRTLPWWTLHTSARFTP